jgi:hypothetical protein
MPKKRIRNTAANRRKALQELGINVPYYTCRVVGGRLEFALYGGSVVYWPAAPAAAKKETADDKAS